MGKPETLGIGLQASDVSGQKLVNVRDVPADASVGELIQGLLGQMSLPENDVEGRPLTYHALLDREGRHLHASERVGDALQEGDRVVLQPNIDAGAVGTA
jgi:hypothetical protein